MGARLSPSIRGYDPDPCAKCLAQPATAEGRANIAWEKSASNPTGLKFRAALVFADILGLWPAWENTNADGDIALVGGFPSATFRYMSS